MKKVILIVLDGYGSAAATAGNAIYNAHPNFINSLIYSYPNTLLKASGEAVGLPAGEVGNTEVGHLNIGAGRIVYQSLPRINLAIADSSFDKNPAFLQSLEHAKKNGGNLHLIGLIGAGSVHSSIFHLYALLHFAKKNNFEKVYIHAITDGRDSPPKSSKNYLTDLENKTKEIGIGQIVSVMGRYYAMDRDKRWDRIEKSYVCLTEGSNLTANNWAEAIDNSYSQGKTDEFIEPVNILVNNEKKVIKDNDSVIFFNYRIDRPRQLTKAFILNDFEESANKMSYDPYADKYLGDKTLQSYETIAQKPFKRKVVLKNLFFTTMTEYDSNIPSHVAFPPISVRMPLGKVLSENGLLQLRMAESEKERFVTTYFNGLYEKPFPGEERIITPSPNVLTYDLKPEMSAFEQTSTLVKNILTTRFDFILINFANADMVGHTGNIEAGIKAIKTLDICLSKIIPTALQFNYSIMVTADHGNAEEMINPLTGETSTEHSGNLVPFIFVDEKFQGRPIKIQKGILADIAPSILFLLDIPKPAEMTGRNLLEEVFI